MCMPFFNSVMQCNPWAGRTMLFSGSPKTSKTPGNFKRIPSLLSQSQDVQLTPGIHNEFNVNLSAKPLSRDGAIKTDSDGPEANPRLQDLDNDHMPTLRTETILLNTASLR